MKLLLPSQPRVPVRQLLTALFLLTALLSVLVYHAATTHLRPIPNFPGAVQHQGRPKLQRHSNDNWSLARRDHAIKSDARDVGLSSLEVRAGGNDILPWDNRVCKGRRLLNIMAATDAASAQTANGGTNPASAFTTYDMLQRWGWQDVGMDGTTPAFGNSLDEALQFLQINEANNHFLGAMHFDEWKLNDDDEEEQDASLGYYQSLFNWVDGIIIADNNISPENQSPDLPAYPQLSQWSDVVFLQWQQRNSIAGTDIANIRYFFRAHVVNEDTQDKVMMALRLRAQQTGATATWPSWATRQTFSMDTDSGKAILGSKNGSGGAFFLAQHKAQLGDKQITEVVVWTTGGRDGDALPASPPGRGTQDPGLNMYFIVV